MRKPRKKRRDECFACTKRICHVRIYREGVIDEIACRDHVRQLERHADKVTLDWKQHITSTMKVSRGPNPTCHVCGDKNDHDHCHMCGDGIADPRFPNAEHRFCEDCARSIAETSKPKRKRASNNE